MKTLTIVGVLLLCFFNSKAQEGKQSQESSIEYFNNFQKCLHDTHNADSAFYNIKKLASKDNNVVSLRELVHHSFAQGFIQRKDGDTNHLNHQLLSQEILKKIVSDTTKLLLETVRPMYLWTKVQQSNGNITALTNLTNEFIKAELSSGDIYKNSAGRYGIMIYQIISKHKELQQLAKKMYVLIYSNLKNNQVVVTGSSSREDLKKRAWYRYLYAYMNYIQSEDIVDINKKESYLKTASDYSPDLMDKKHNTGYFYEMFFLFDGKEKHAFKIDYLSFLISTGKDKNKALSTMLELALIEPEYKNKLKEFYNASFATIIKFNDYWMNAVNNNAEIASPISLYLLDEKPFSSKQLVGKWVLVDFWGTWCGPCRREHPIMQKFSDLIILPNTQKNFSCNNCLPRFEGKGVILHEGKRFYFPCCYV